jgi:hypothetical protein
MHLKTLMIILLASIGLKGFSQPEKLVIKFCPLAFLDLNGPSLQAGIEVRLSNKITWYNEAGIKIAGSISENYSDTSFIGSGGFKIKSEIRYYLINKSKFKGVYSAANVFLVHDQHNREIDYTPLTDTTSRIDDFGVKKNVYGLNIVCGQQKILSKRFLMDIYAGVGVRLRNITTVNKEYNKNIHHIRGAIDTKIYQIGESADANAGSSVVPNFTCGVRFCYRL